jgi:hypothetical protein
MTAHAICQVSDCEAKHFGLGYCSKHYKRWRKYGDPATTAFVREPGKVCSVPDCIRPHKARGYCASHWRRWKDSGLVPTTPITAKPRGRLSGPCMRPNCDAASRGSGYCSKHYSRMQAFMRYGLTGWDDFDDLWARAGGQCEICRVDLDVDGTETHIDHCHQTGVARGLLCRGCNHGLGQFQDDPERLYAAAKYLMSFSAR